MGERALIDGNTVKKLTNGNRQETSLDRIYIVTEKGVENVFPKSWALDSWFTVFTENICNLVRLNKIVERNNLM